MSAGGDLLKLGIPFPRANPRATAKRAMSARNAISTPTEPWVTKALLNAVDFCLTPGMSRTQTLIWEPACGDGRMAEPIKAAHYKVYASDIGDYGYGFIRWLPDPAAPGEGAEALL